MITFIVNAIKIIFLLGFLILIHESGHFIVAKLCKVKVNEFSIGFGKTIWQKKKNDTKYSIKLIPLGGYVSMEGETENSEKEGSFSKASIPKRIAIVMAGAAVNIIFGLIVYFIFVTIVIKFANPIDDTILNRIQYGIEITGKFIGELGKSVVTMFTGGIQADQMMGPVGISEVVASTQGFGDYVYILAVISISLGVTNLLPIPALDGGKIVLLIIEAIRRKPLKLETEVAIQFVGFSLLILLAIYVTYNDVLKVF